MQRLNRRKFNYKNLTYKGIMQFSLKHQTTASYILLPIGFIFVCNVYDQKYNILMWIKTINILALSIINNIIIHLPIIILMRLFDYDFSSIDDWRVCVGRNCDYLYCGGSSKSKSWQILRYALWFRPHQW